MASTAPEITLKHAATLKNHPPPKLASISPSLAHFKYAPSRDGTDSNLLVLFHGLGDTAQPFFQLGQSLNLPQTAVLAIQAPERVPLLEEDAWQWWESFTPLGELIPNPNPSATLALLLPVLDHLTAPISPSPSSSSTPASSSSSKPKPALPGCGWSPSQIHLFGYQQGASLAGELALAFSRSRASPPSSSSSSPSPPLSLGSLVTVSAPLLSPPTGAGTKSATKVAVVHRAGEERRVGVPGWRKGFAEVREVKLEGGRGREGMPRGVGEWREIMRFWSEVLLRRSALETDGGEVYEIAGGVAAARAAGAGATAGAGAKK
ncbi:hypothetical protein JCM6882_003642 [Rhodosporidiobolus microsporus]